MKNKFATRVAAGALAFAMVATTVVGGYSDVYAATKTGAVKKVVTVSTQKKLNAALKKDHVKRVIIKTKKAVDFKISSVSYYKKKLTVNAPKSIVVNYGDFKKVYVKDAKKYIEKGEGNSLFINDSNNLTLTVPKNVYTNSVNLTGAGGEITLNGAGTLDTLIITNYTKLTMAKNITINKLIVLSDADLKINGVVNEISVENAGTVLKITGNTTVTPKVIVNGENSVIESNIKVDVKANANIEVKLDEGAKGSTVDAAKGVETKIDNQTGEEVKTSKSESTDKKDSTSSSGTSAAEKKKEKQTAPTFSDASLTFDSPNEATVTFDKRKDLGKLKFAIYKNGNETELATDTANTDEEAAGTQVTIATDGFEPEKTYVVKARYTATNNADASDWANVATGTAPEWVAQASLSSTEATISLGETATLPSVVSGYVYNQGEYKREIRINKWVLKSKPENASDSSYDKAGKYVWEPELITGYKFLYDAPQYTVTVTKATQEAPTFSGGSVGFASSSKSVVNFEYKNDLANIEFAIFKSKDENALATYTATADEVTAGTQVTINLKEQLNEETEYVVKARYAETENLEASDWAEVKSETTPKWITEASLSKNAETINLNGTTEKPTLTASASALKVDTTGVIWVLKSKPEGASDSSYDVKGQYVWEPEVVGYGFANGAPQYTVTVKGKYTVDGKNVTGTADASAKTLSFNVAEDLQNGYSFKITLAEDNEITGNVENNQVTFDLGSNWAYDTTYEVKYCRNEDEKNYASGWAIYGKVTTQELITGFEPLLSFDIEGNTCSLSKQVRARIEGKKDPTQVDVVAWNILSSGDVTVDKNFNLTFKDNTKSCKLQATVDTSEYALGEKVELPTITIGHTKE